MAAKRYAAAGSESEFRPRSRGRVLRNLLGITRVREMEEAETDALDTTQREALQAYGPSHRFTPTDIRHLHRMWLGENYPLGGNYRKRKNCEGGFPFGEGAP